jgi:hypothetical protein
MEHVDRARARARKLKAVRFIDPCAETADDI